MHNSANINMEFCSHVWLLRDMLHDRQHPDRMGKHAETGYALAQEAQQLVLKFIHAKDRIHDTRRFAKLLWILDRCICFLQQVQDGCFRTQFFQLPGRKQRAYDEMRVRCDELSWFVDQVELVLDGKQPEIESV